MRVLAVWCPDWPVVAALLEEGLPATAPAAVIKANVVEVCNEEARREGVRRGQRRRDAQGRCPELRLLASAPDRDGRAFEPVLETVEALRPGVAALRPGLLAVRAPGRWFGTEENAAATICEALVETGVWDVRQGVADDLFCAEQAARWADLQGWRVVPAGGAATFLRDLPLQVLEQDPQGREVVGLLRRLGLSSLGDLAGLPAQAVEHRLGAFGSRLRRQARGEDPTSFHARTPPPDLECEVVFEPPLDSVEAVAFSVRRTADRLVEQLAARQLVCTAVRVEACTDDGGASVPTSVRTWLHPRFFSPADLVDRVHWQLSPRATGGVRSRKDAGVVAAPVERVRLVPETVEPAAAHGEGLWGGAGDELVERGVARVQGMVGFEAVRRPVLQGGRTPAARQADVVWGERAVDLRPLDRPWPGRVPGPPPALVFRQPPPSEVVDDAGVGVRVTERGAVTGVPTSFRPPSGGWQPVLSWAGPWPVDEGWWQGAEGRCARFQVVGADGRAWLLRCADDGWTVEAGYD
ncbi:MAG: DNA polymerase [Nocardioides sp.]|nr:DNA polymerase [Nocardioides sp.]